MHTIKSIFAAKTLYLHLLIRLVLFCFCVGIAYIFVVPLIYWSILGEGAVGDAIADEPFNAFLFQYSSLMVALMVIGILFSLNVRKKDFSKAKSYIITGSIVTILYLFNEPIAELFF